MIQKKVLLGITLVFSIIAFMLIGATLVIITEPAPQVTQPEFSDNYWNQVHVSEYLAEKLWNGRAEVIRGGLGRVVISVNGTAYEYKCHGVFNCTEGFVGNGT